VASIATAGSFVTGGATNSSATASTLTVNQSTTTTFGAALAGNLNVANQGSGVLTLTGANPFTGTASITGGTLVLARDDGEALTGLSGLTVGSGATLLISESNQVRDAATVSLSGGTITRGSGVSEVFGNLNLTGASSLDFGLGDIGTLSFGTYTASALLTVQNFLPGNKLQFATGFNTALLPTGGDLSNENFSFSNGFTTGTEGDYFTITAIPEPSTYLAAAGLIGLMLWPSRRRIIRDVKKILGLTPPMRDRLAKARQ
jgi:autotransporter-associated beta strand protein